MAGLKIVRVTQGFEWIDMNIRLETVANHTVLANENRKDDEGYILLYTLTARNEMFEFIRWENLNARENRVEQGGLIAGYHYRIPETGEKISVAAHVFPLYTANSNASYLDARAQDWSQAYQAMERMGRESGRPLEVIGWFHTHPNGLPTFMSGTDRETMRKNFNAVSNYALVLNPHTTSWKAFRSADVKDAICYMLDTDDLQSLCKEEKEIKETKKQEETRKIKITAISHGSEKKAEEPKKKKTKEKEKKPQKVQKKKKPSWNKRKKAKQRKRITRKKK